MENKKYSVGDKIQLKNQEVEIEECRECKSLMVNLDADQLSPGDLTTLKKAGVVISNAETDKAVCIKCEYKTFGRKVADFFESNNDDDDDDDDDSSFFSGGGFIGRASQGGFGGGGLSGGGFGGWGGGGFGGGGASRGF